MELCLMLYGSLEVRGVWGRMGTCICMAASLHCSPETATTLFVNGCVLMLSPSVVSNFLQLHGLYPTRFLCLWGFSRQEHWSGLACLLPGNVPNPGIEPRSPALQVYSLPFEPPGKPKNAGVGSLSILLGNFPTQELNQGLLHCRQILYQLSYQGSP